MVNNGTECAVDRIIRATEREIPGIGRLLVQVNDVHAAVRPDLFCKGGRKYADEQLESILQDPGTPVFVALDKEGGVLGYIFCAFERRTYGEGKIVTLYIDDLCVDERARGSHVGSALLQYAEDFARSAGCYNVTLNVWEGNDTALRFYEDRGLTKQKTGLEKIL